MKNFVRIAFAVTVLATAASGFAQPGGTSTASERDRIAAVFEAKTGMKAGNIEVSPVTNFYEVTVGMTVYYMERSGKWLFDGNLVDLDTRTSVTAQKKLELEKVGLPTLDWKTLNLGDAVKTVRGKAVAGRVLVTFEDPNCGYCKRLHRELEKIQNLTVFTYPIALLGPDSQAKNEALWCVKDRAAAWSAAMQSKPVKAEAPCDIGGLTRNAELARRLQVNGTPTMFLADGSRVPGFMDAGAIEAKLSAQQSR